MYMPSEMTHSKTAQLPQASHTLADFSEQPSRWQTLPDFLKEMALKLLRYLGSHLCFESLTSLNLTSSCLG